MASAETAQSAFLLNREPDVEEEVCTPLSEEEALQKSEKLLEEVRQKGNSFIPNTIRESFGVAYRKVVHAEVTREDRIYIECTVSQIHDLAARPEVQDFSPDAIERIAYIATECMDILHKAFSSDNLSGGYRIAKKESLDSLRQRAAYLRSQQQPTV